MRGPQETVYLHYTQAELDRNFDQRGWVANAEAVVARYTAQSMATQARLHHQDLAYGDGPDERLDLFSADGLGSPAPVMVFVHGGAWRNFGKADFSFVADTFVAAGMHTAVLDFTCLPAGTLPGMAEQVRTAIAWIHGNAGLIGADPDRLHLCGHSSGAHLSALALATDWRDRGLPAGLIRSAALVSGVYDFEPVMLSARRDHLALDQGDVYLCDAIRHVEAIRSPVYVAYAENDTDEFQRQSEAFASTLEQTGRLAGLQCFDGLNHFEIMEAIGNPGSAVAQAIVAQARASGAAG